MERAIIRFKQTVSFLVLLALTNLAHAAGAGCPRDVLIKDIQATIKKSGGTIEPVHLKDGIAIVVTTKSASAVKAVHKSVDAYLAKRTGYAAPSAGNSCASIMKSVAAKQLSEQAEKTSTGALLLYGTSDNALVEKLHKDDCCNWCVCPAGSVTSCARCC